MCWIVWKRVERRTTTTHQPLTLTHTSIGAKLKRLINCVLTRTDIRHAISRPQMPIFDPLYAQTRVHKSQSSVRCIRCRSTLMQSPLNTRWNQTVIDIHTGHVIALRPNGTARGVKSKSVYLFHRLRLNNAWKAYALFNFTALNLVFLILYTRTLTG